MNIKQWLVQSTLRLKKSYSPSARLDSEILLRKITGLSKNHLYYSNNINITSLQEMKLEKLLKRRENGEPISYLTKEKEFWSLKLEVSKNTLIPRPETELLVERALKISSFFIKIKVLDLGTGNGAISLALASERNLWDITGIDKFNNVIFLAKKNAIKLGLKNVKFYQGNWFKPVYKKRYDLIVSNPPYISSDDPYLLRGDIRFEPISALVSDNNGLGDLIKICNESFHHLLPGGWLILEHAWNQGSKIRNILINSNFHKVNTFLDYSNNERITQGQRF